MSDCNHTTLESCLRADECAECLREAAKAHSLHRPGSAAGPKPEEYAEASLQTAINALRDGRYVDSYIECASAMAAIVKAKELRSPKPPNK